MGKKKPKKSPVKSPAKSHPMSSPTSALENSPRAAKDYPPSESTVVSDAQIDSAVEAVAQHHRESSDLESSQQTPPSSETVIANSMADPSSATRDVCVTNLELSSGGPPHSSSSVESKEVASPGEGLNLEVPIQIAPSSDKPNPVRSQLADETSNVGKSSTSEEAKGQSLSQQEATPAANQEAAGPIEREAATREVLGSPRKDPTDTWCAHAKGVGKRLSKKGEAFTLPSGEA